MKWRKKCKLNYIKGEDYKLLKSYGFSYAIAGLKDLLSVYVDCINSDVNMNEWKIKPS